MDFIEFDKYLKKYPKNMTQLIYDYYSNKCNKCNMIQNYCIECKQYQCFCIRTISYCKVTECNKLLCCFDGKYISKNPKDERKLCTRCWRIDIYQDILQDIHINGS